MSVHPAPSGTGPWWAPASTASRKHRFPRASTGDGAGAGIPVAAVVLGGAGLVLAAAGFFLPANATVITVLAAVALAGAALGALLGAWGVRRPLGELGVAGLVAGALALPLAVFDLLMAASWHLG